jgi:DNA-binding response OmpR family regulator
VRDGEAAHSALRQDGFDLAVLDLGLPKLPGIEVLRRLRRRGNPIPVLILTATDGVEERGCALDAGADDYVAKPFDLDEVCARLRALHRRAVGCASPMLRHRDLEIDLAERSLTAKGREVALTPKEFAILQTLVENAGKTVSRQRLMMSIYGWDDDVGSNALEVHIHHLRHKVSCVVVKAIRGVGYRLD